MLSPDGSLLAALHGTAFHIPATELAARAGLSLASCAERLEVLREAGFEWEHHPTLGYRLLTYPDRLIADDLWARLATASGTARPLPDFLREIIVLAETGSTNDVVAQLGRGGMGGGTLVLAESQTSGRGRFGRRWASAAGRGLWLSLLLRPTWPVAHWPRLTTWAAVAVAEAVDCHGDAGSTIKWPNDVQVRGRKVAGILIEMGSDRAAAPFAVVGIGLNVNHEAADFPNELAGQATSLREVLGRPVDRAAVLVSLLTALHAHWPDLTEKFPSLVAEASRRSSLLGRWVQVRQGEGRLEGFAEGLDANGHLFLRRADGQVQTLNAGEVSLAVGANTSESA